VQLDGALVLAAPHRAVASRAEQEVQSGYPDGADQAAQTVAAIIVDSRLTNPAGFGSTEPFRLFDVVMKPPYYRVIAGSARSRNRRVYGRIGRRASPSVLPRPATFDDKPMTSGSPDGDLKAAHVVLD
jgi:hypothetical protein